jgi:5-methylcytosine-specific restriction protein A
MPYKPLRPCSAPGCPALTDGQYCGHHKKLVDAHYNKYERDPTAAKQYGRLWRRVR